MFTFKPKELSGLLLSRSVGLLGLFVFLYTELSGLLICWQKELLGLLCGI